MTIEPMFEVIIRALLRIGEMIWSMIGLGYAAEKHMRKDSVIGESQMDKDAREWYVRILDFLDLWWVSTVLICIVLPAIGYAFWHHLKE